MSFLGFALWIMGSAMCVLTALLLRSLHKTKLRRTIIYLTALAFTGMLLGLDDMLRFHEALFVYYLHIPEQITLIAYGVFLAALWILFFPQIRSHHMLFIILFYLLLAFSQLVDILRVDMPILQSRPIDTLMEECSKFLGIAGYALDIIRNRV